MKASGVNTPPLDCPTIAVSETDFNLYGCPGCGGIFGNPMVSGRGGTSWVCDDCGRQTIITADGLTESPFGIGDPTVYPEVQTHPREGQPIDRSKLIEGREQSIRDNEMTDLMRWLSLGYGQPVEVTQVGQHISKSRKLLIVAVKPEESSVAVTWFAQNYYFYFLGLTLDRAIPATLLYPIHAIFGSYGLSGHVNTEIAPPLTNFDKAYHNCQPISRFGANCGTGWGGAQTIRFLQAVSQLDMDAILDVCLRKTQIGPMDNIDGNHINITQLLDIVGLRAGGSAVYEVAVQDIPTDIFERVEVDFFDILLGGSSVHVVMAEGVPLPSIGLTDIYVDVRDTAIGDYLPKEAQPERITNITGHDHLITKVPVRLLHSSRERYLEERERGKRLTYPTSGANSLVNSGTREFTFNVPNPLDAVMTAFHLVKVLAPMMK